MNLSRSAISWGVCLVSASALLTEVSLIRAFDVLFFPNLSYMIITCSLFAYGIAGVYSSVRLLPPGENILKAMGIWSALLSLSIFMILPIMNVIPFNIRDFSSQPLRQLVYFGIIYLLLALPFFWTGRIFTVLFSKNAGQIRELYFWDLAGAALGSVLLIPFIRIIGPGGLLFIATSLSILASALFLNNGRITFLSGILVVVLVVVPFIHAPSYFDFKEHQDKRGVKSARENGLVEVTIWDPISKIDIINYETVRYIAYDGGSQTSLFYPFDGDFQTLKNNLPTDLEKHFWQRGVLVSHMLREGSSPNVLVIGSAGGQEIKAALLYGAKHVDGVELVGAVVDLGKKEYAEYTGNLFLHSAVSLYVDEGRNFLRANQSNYDIIQIFSNHTSSSVAAGTGAAATNYLQTSDAYKEYFSRLNENGILHINHYYYPKMITTAALAWSQSGREDFERHVVVYEYSLDATLPTMLIKMQPWTEDELKKTSDFFKTEFPGEDATYTMEINPLHPERNSIPPSYFTGQLSQLDIETANVRIQPATDDRPYFNLLERSFNPFPNGLGDFMKHPFANIPLDLVTIYVSGFVALFYGILFILIPLNYSTAGRQKWRNKTLSLIYFSCLGLGFIVVEFVFIQMFMHVIGSPLYTVSTILFVMLLSAGIGSFMSGKLKISYQGRWSIPFIGIFFTVLMVLLLLPLLKPLFLGTQLLFRMVFVSLFVFPVGFFLGMPFPLGISTLEFQPDGVIAWAWGMNGLFTIIGGLLAVIFSIQWGFTITLLIASCTYLLALIVFSRIRIGLPNLG